MNGILLAIVQCLFKILWQGGRRVQLEPAPVDGLLVRRRSPIRVQDIWFGEQFVDPGRFDSRYARFLWSTSHRDESGGDAVWRAVDSMLRIARTPSNGDSRTSSVNRRGRQ